MAKISLYIKKYFVNSSEGARPGPRNRLSHHGSRGFRIDLALSREGAEVDVQAGARTEVVNRVEIVVVTVLDGVDDPVHQRADHGRVLELVATRADGDVEARQRGLVVDRRPVLGDV